MNTPSVSPTEPGSDELFRQHADFEKIRQMVRDEYARLAAEQQRLDELEASPEG
jgi:hypothetical protein